jgi:hypothetical protein
MYELETLEAKATALFQSGLFKASADIYVQAHCLISNLGRFLEPLESSLRRELELQDVRLLMNATMAYLKSAQFELSFNEEARKLIVMANFYACQSFELLQEHYGIPKNITQKNISRLFQKPLDIQLLELPNLLKDPTRPSFDIVPDYRADWTFILCLISWSK